MRINGARVDDAFVSPNLVEQTVPLLHAPAPLHQCAQKFEFKTGQIDAFTVNGNFVTRWIDHNWTGTEMLLIWFSLAATQDRPNAQNHFAWAKGFRHIIVGAKF